MVFHIDRSDPAECRRILGKKFCLSGGLSNTLLAFGSRDDVRRECRSLIETLGVEGGYLMDASAIIQNDATVENMIAMTEATLEYGVYRSPSSPSPQLPAPAAPATPGIPAWVTAPKIRPGICFPFEEKLKEMPPILGDPAVVRRVWEDTEALAYLYIWHLLLSF